MASRGRAIFTWGLGLWSHRQLLLRCATTQFCTSSLCTSTPSKCSALRPPAKGASSPKRWLPASSLGQCRTLAPKSVWHQRSLQMRQIVGFAVDAINLQCAQDNGAQVDMAPAQLAGMPAAAAAQQALSAKSDEHALPQVDMEVHCTALHRILVHRLHRGRAGHRARYTCSTCCAKADPAMEKDAAALLGQL